MVCTLIVIVHSLPKELEIDDSVEMIESDESESESESETESSTMVISTTTASTTTTAAAAAASTSTMSTVWRPSRTTTTARPFQPLRPNRPLASMVHSTLQTIESVVVTAGILATTLMETLMPNSTSPSRDINKSNTPNEIKNSHQPEYSKLDFRENELHYNFE